MFWDISQERNFHVHYIWPFDIFPDLIKMGYKIKPDEVAVKEDRTAYWGSATCDEDICEKSWDEFWKRNKGEA